MKYPKSAYYIAASAFCDTFASIGLRTVLPLYLVDIMMCDENTAMVIFHTFISIGYLNSVIISLFADSRLGRYRILLYIGIIYAIGELSLTVTSIPALRLPVWEFSILSLLIISLCPSTVFACLMPFGGDQFQLPRQQKYLNSFYTFAYYSMYSAVLVATYVLPRLRKDITCFGMNSCYPLTFFALTLFVILYTVAIFSGRHLYTKKKSDSIVALKVMRCIYHGIARKIKASGSKREHWLNYANNKYDRNFIEDIKTLLNVLKLCIPLPIYWAAFRQQSSRWTFQATRMDGEVFGYLIKPDQFHVVQPILMMILIPCFHFFIYPLMGKVMFISTPLRKMTLGGLLLSLAFAVSGIVEHKIEPTYAVQPSEGLAQVRIFNTIDCNASLHFNEYQYPLGALDVYQNLHLPINHAENYTVKVEYRNCPYSETTNYSVVTSMEIMEAQAISWILTKKGISSGLYDKIEKSRSGDPKLRTLVDLDSDIFTSSTLKFDGGKKSYTIDLINDTQGLTSFIEVIHDSYNVILDEQVIAENFFPKFGGVYTIIGQISNTAKMTSFVTLVEPNSIHIFWQLPQYVLVCLSEMMFMINGLEFIYSQAPSNMKSVSFAVWSLTAAFGDVLVVVIANAQFFKRQVTEFVFYALLLFVDMIIFAVMAVHYNYIDISSNGNRKS